MMMMMQWPVNAISLFVLLFTGKRIIFIFPKKVLKNSAFVSCSVSRLTKRTKEFNLFLQITSERLLFSSSCFFLFVFTSKNTLSLFCLFSLTAKDNLVFLQRWFLKFPHYLNRSLFITGESYAGNIHLFFQSLHALML